MPFVNSNGFVVVVVGATGAVGEDLAKALALSALPVRELRLVGSVRSTTASDSSSFSSVESLPRVSASAL